MRSIIFLQNVWWEISHLHMWVQNNYSPASDSTYYYVDGGGNEAKYIPSLQQSPRPDTVASTHGTDFHGRSM
jgi:hypothetical protein